MIVRYHVGDGPLETIRVGGFAELYQWLCRLKVMDGLPNEATAAQLEDIFRGISCGRRGAFSFPRDLADEGRRFTIDFLEP